MRILHTSDWHIGKKIGRFDRMAEYEQVIDEVVGIAKQEQVDLVVNSGDLFDRPRAPNAALRLGLDGLVRLSRGGAVPVVAIAGNHDDPAFFETLAPYLKGHNVHLIGEVKKPEEGGVIRLNTASGSAVVSCFPFLREGRTFDAWSLPEEHYKSYAGRLRAISHAYAEHADRVAAGQAVTVLTAHFLVGGAKVHGHGAPRGERALHMGEVYAMQPGQLPPGPQYVAMGHIHAPQPVPAAITPAEYAGSLMQLDFGEAGDRNRVVIVDVLPGRPAAVSSVDLTAGRRLRRASGTWAELSASTDLDDCYLDLVVTTEGPEPGLADLARERFKYVVKVRAEYPREEQERRAREGRGITDLYGDYYRRQEGVDPPDDLGGALRGLLEEVRNPTS